MYLYNFMMKRYRDNYQQFLCIATFQLMLLPVLGFAVFIRHASQTAFHVLLFLSGWCTWTFAEYILHRFWMHHKNSNSALAQIHHHHHTHPTELVITSFHRVAMAAVLAVLLVMAVRMNNYFSFLVGLCFGLEGYFLMHQFLHLKTGQKVFKRLVRYHIYHHCKYPNTCFGISVPWWDDLFKTVPRAPKISQRIVEFYFNEHMFLEYAWIINCPKTFLCCKRVFRCAYGCSFRFPILFQYSKVQAKRRCCQSGYGQSKAHRV